MNQDKISSWAEVMSDKIVKGVKEISADNGLTIEDAFALYMTESCAGSASVELAVKKLGL